MLMSLSSVHAARAPERRRRLCGLNGLGWLCFFGSVNVLSSRPVLIWD